MSIGFSEHRLQVSARRIQRDSGPLRVVFETLATHLYGEAVRGTYEDGAIAALLIVVAGLVPVLLLARVGRTVSASR